ncbi:type IV secretion system DNA-binding domain-containing protein [Mucilaginibacter sp.]|uniref:type IV secretory system conjugative DNA transfer family protein n=1 Tax=Mucilaginibacter sp. TaxID=1882438 RepID=UPI0032652452
MNDTLHITPIGTANYQSSNTAFGIKDKDRLGHIYAIGKTGTGKSTLLLNMAISDIMRGNGFCVIDPHGDVAETLLDHIPDYRVEDVIYFNPQDIEFPIAFNPLKKVHPNYHHVVAAGLISTFKKIWADNWGPRLEHILRFTLLTLLEYQDATLLDIQPLLTDMAFRGHILAKVNTPQLLAFWYNEFNKYSNTLRSEAISPILNKVGIFTSSSLLRNIVGQKSRSFHLQKVMDEGKILIVNVGKGAIGEDVSSLLGSMLVTSIQLAALHRAKQPEHTRRPFYLYVDECHSFLTDSFSDILAESRKYGLGLFLANQYIEQLKEETRSAIFGNVGTLISFRIGATDAHYLAKEFHPVFTETDLVNLPRYSMYLKLMIDGATSHPFSADSNPIQHKKQLYGDEVITVSRSNFGKRRSDVEHEIEKRYKQVVMRSTAQQGLFDNE